MTKYLPMLQGATEFKVYYGGFDATSTRAHTVTLTFALYESTPTRSAVYFAKVYGSSRDGNSGYRALEDFGFRSSDFHFHQNGAHCRGGAISSRSTSWAINWLNDCPVSRYSWRELFFWASLSWRCLAEAG